MSEPEPVQYTHGDIVWVNLRFCWWPGEVVEYDKLPENVRDELQFKKMPLAIVTFFQEDSYEYIKNTKHIFSYNCLRKDEFIKKGIDLQRAKYPFMKNFSSDIIVAEKMTQGNENILSDPKYGPPKPKEIYEGIFPSLNKKTKDKLKRFSGNDSPSRKKPAEPFVTHPRFVGYDDHQIRMLIQSPDKVQEQVDNNTYTCQTCGFSSNRLGVIMIHNKTHISSPGMGKKAKRTPIKKVNRRGLFRIPHSSTSSIDEDIARIEQGLSITEDDFSSHEDEEDENQPKVKRKKVTPKGRKSGKKPKVDSKTKEEEKTDVDVLAEWDDGEEVGTEEKEDESASKVEDKATEDEAFTNEDAFSAAVEKEKVSYDKTISEPVDDKSTEIKESTSEEVDKSCCDFKETQEKVESETTVNLDKRKSAEPMEDPNLPTAEDDANRTIDNQSNSETLAEKTIPEPDSSSFKKLMETKTLPELPEMPATLKCEKKIHNSKRIKFPDKTKLPPASATKLTNPKKRFVKSFEKIMEKENENKKSKIDPVVEDTSCKSIVFSNKSFEDFQCSLLNTGIVTETETLLKDEQIGSSYFSSMKVDMICASPIDKKIDKMDSKKETQSKTIKFPDKTESPPASATKLTNPKKRFVKSFEETMEKENGNKKSKIDPVVEDTPCKSIAFSNKSFEDFHCSLLNTGIVTETETLPKDEQIGASSFSSMEVDIKKETRSSKKELKLKSDVFAKPTRELRRDKTSKDSKDVSIKVTVEEKKKDVKVKEQKPGKLITKEEDSKFHGRKSLREKRQSKLTREASKESDFDDNVVKEIEEPLKQELESKIILEEKAKEQKNCTIQKAKIEGKSGKKKVKTIFEEEIIGKQKEVKKKSCGLKDIKNIDAEEEAKPKKDKAKNVKKLNFEAALESADTVFDESKRRKKHLESQTKDKPEVEKSKKSSKVESGKHDLQDDLPNKAGKSNRLSKGAYVKVKKDSKVETNTIEKTIKEDTEKSKSKISETVLVLENEKRDEEEEPEKEEILNEIKQMKKSARASKNEQTNTIEKTIKEDTEKSKSKISETVLVLENEKRDEEEEPEKEEILNEIKQMKKSARASKNEQKNPEDVVENIDFTPSKRKKTRKCAASSLPNENIQKDKSKLPAKEEYLLSTMFTQMCSSLSEPPPDIFDFGNLDPSFELEQKDVDIPVTSSDGFGIDKIHSPSAISTDDSVEIPAQLKIMTNTGSGSPKWSLDRKDKKLFTGSIFIPLLTEDPEDADSSLPNEIIQKDKSKLPVKEIYLLSTIFTQMSSSLSEPPPDMFDFGNMDPSFELEQKDVDIPVISSDGYGVDKIHSPGAISTDNSVEIPDQPEIVTNTGSRSPKRSLDRKDKKPFTESISIPLLTEVPEDAASSLPSEIIQMDKSKLPVKEEYLLSTMSTQMCSSLSEPPPDMFDFGNMDPSFELEQKDVDIPVTSSDGFGVDKIHSPGAVSTDDCVE